MPVVSVFLTVPNEPNGVATLLTLTVCVLLKSTSVKAIVPLSVMLPLGVPNSVTAPVTLVAVKIGRSFVPVI